MPHRRPAILWTPLLAITVMASAHPLRAADSASASDGYKTVNVDSGGQTVPIRVKQAPDPLAHVHLDDELDHQRAFSATNPMSNKSFPVADVSGLQGSNDFNKKSDANTFNTRAYAFDANAPTVPNLNSKPGFHSASFPTQTASGYDKNFTTSVADARQNETSPFATQTASEQGRQATLGGQTTSTFASPLTNQKFNGDEADAAKRHLKRLDNGQIEVENLPDRALTIDEVRQLINHGFAPDTSEKPQEAPSKPLNDPNYQPQPLRDNPAPDSSAESAPTSASAPARSAIPVSDDDKDDPVPPPGTMAAPPPPENSQPLPQP